MRIVRKVDLPGFSSIYIVQIALFSGIRFTIFAGHSGRLGLGWYFAIFIPASFIHSWFVT
jgi:hypothetical protein